MNYQNSPLTKAITDKFSNLAQVLTVALAGSRTSGFANETSDYDFYIYIQEEIPVETREVIAKEFTQHLEINNQFWETGDEWIDSKTGCGIDIMYRTPQWIEQQLEQVLSKHQASVGYSTCFWWNILTSENLYDKTNWFKQLQQQANQPYPEPLKQAIIAKNYPILRNNISSYTKQIELAIKRNDSISIIHRTTALLASYFDIIFAINSIPHPGEKRLVQQANKLCSKIPEDMEKQICAIHNSIASPANLLDHIHSLIDNLDKVLNIH